MVVSNEINNRVAPTVTILPISSRVPGAIYPFLVLLQEGEGGLDRASVVKANQIRTVDKRRLIRRLGLLDPGRMADIERAIRIHMGLQ